MLLCDNFHVFEVIVCVCFRFARVVKQILSIVLCCLWDMVWWISHRIRCLLFCSFFPLLFLFSLRRWFFFTYRQKSVDNTFIDYEQTVSDKLENEKYIREKSGKSPRLWRKLKIKQSLCRDEKKRKGRDRGGYTVWLTTNTKMLYQFLTAFFRLAGTFL